MACYGYVASWLEAVANGGNARDFTNVISTLVGSVVNIFSNTFLFIYLIFIYVFNHLSNFKFHLLVIIILKVRIIIIIVYSSFKDNNSKHASRFLLE